MRWRPDTRTATDSPTVLALKVAIKALREIEQITATNSHGVEHIGRIVARCLWEIGEIVQ